MVGWPGNDPWGNRTYPPALSHEPRTHRRALLTSLC